MGAQRRRTKQILFYVTQEEDDLISEKMLEAGVANKSAYLRKMAVNGFVIRQDFDALRQLTIQIVRVGTNLNQLTKNVNTYGVDDLRADTLAEMRKELNAVWQQLNSSLLS